ncbi:hypothetical protein Pmani_004757 [Petrolisthes manimaculis]|uniref:Methyltransferase domain-containing protein n=1 Tax=Petrolisthes manimaculis TaxID=1843537 RepID=A0AAE1QDM3_9EUCA|nr:hypothetical protein Pmani_023756 [Petrolisthes manimaculis]KAK4309533.1 hypothetical protein Pmani_018843 [Petrolisthes manimaculis]KAK4324614.1 hypothetical protein Pmani_004757 [Petrolisthes manimaculis]
MDPEIINTLQQTYKTIDERGDPELVVAMYGDFSTNYDEIMSKAGYRAPAIAAEEVSIRVPENQRKDVRVLDVAAGTGLIGKELTKKGFTNIDAVEPSDSMMKQIKSSGIYTLMFQEFLGLGQNTIPKGTYDIVVSAGAIRENHIPLSGIDDMIHFTKTGGLVVLLMNNFDVGPKTKAESHMNQLEEKGLWCKESAEILPNYFLGKEGIVFIYRVL